jgi:hypothetical protein
MSPRPRNRNCWVLALALSAGLSCRPASVSDASAAKRRRPAAAVDPGDTIEGCRTKPIDSGLLVSCVADRFALELPGLSEGFVWSFRRPPDPTQTHVIFVAEDSRKNGDLYSLSVLVGPEADQERDVASQLASLYERLRKETRESGKSDPRNGRDLGPAHPCRTSSDHEACLTYDVRGMVIDGKPVLSTHAWSARRREDGSVLFFHAAWAGYAAQRAEQHKQVAKATERTRALVDASFVIDAEGRRVAH